MSAAQIAKYPAGHDVSFVQGSRRGTPGEEGLMEWIYAKGIPIEAQYLYRKAMDYTQRGRDDEALKYLRQSVVIAPAYAKALFEMGNCFARLGKFEEAREKYERAARIEPGLPAGL
jgi:tetratricopeptide (TPR) repeat protein